MLIYADDGSLVADKFLGCADANIQGRDVEMRRRHCAEPDLKRVFETPKKGIGKTTVAKVFAGEDIPAAAQIKVGKVYEFLDNVLTLLKTEALSHVIQTIIVDSGMEKEMLEASLGKIPKSRNSKKKPLPDLEK